MGSRATEGESPVDESVGSPLPSAYQSSARLVKPCVKLGGPPPKAKYSLTTDSEPVRRLKDEKHRNKRSKKYLKPCTYKQPELYGPQGQRVTAYLLHNEPASCTCTARLTCLRRGAEVKASVKCATQSYGADPKPRDLLMARLNPE